MQNSSGGVCFFLDFNGRSEQTNGERKRTAEKIPTLSNPKGILPE